MRSLKGALAVLAIPLRSAENPGSVRMQSAPDSQYGCTSQAGGQAFTFMPEWLHLQSFVEIL